MDSVFRDHIPFPTSKPKGKVVSRASAIDHGEDVTAGCTVVRIENGDTYVERLFTTVRSDDEVCSNKG